MAHTASFKVHYPGSCPTVSISLSIDELKSRLSVLEKHLTEMADADAPMSNTLDVDSDISSPSYMTHEDQPEEKSELKKYGGLFMHLLQDAFIEHPDVHVRLRVCAASCAIMRITCPNSPLAGHHEEVVYVEKFFTLIMNLLNEFENVRDKKDAKIPLLDKILTALCCKEMPLSLWAGMLPNGSDFLDATLRTTFLVVKRLSTWCDKSQLEDRRQQLLSMLSDVLKHRQSMLKMETLVYLLCFLLQSTKEAQPLQYQFACDLIQNDVDYLQYSIQIILQRALFIGHIPLEVDGNVTRAGDTSTVTLKRQESDLELADMSLELDDGVIKDLGDKVPYLIYVLHKLRNSIVNPILPLLENKLKSSVSRERKHTVNLLVKLYTEPNSTLHATHPQLFPALLARFTDADSEIRKSCVMVTPRLMRCPDIPHRRLCNAMCLRSRDPDENVRHCCLKTIHEMLATDDEWLRSLAVVSSATSGVAMELPAEVGVDWHAPLDDLLGVMPDSAELAEEEAVPSGSLHSPLASTGLPNSSQQSHMMRQLALKMFQVLTQRSRDTLFWVRKEAITALAVLYRKALQLEKSLHGDLPGHASSSGSASAWVDRRMLKACVDVVMRLYYQDDYHDKINVERLFKTFFVPYNNPPAERMKNLVLMYCLMADSSVKVVQEIFKVQFTVSYHVRQVTLRLFNAGENSPATPDGKKRATSTPAPGGKGASASFHLEERQQKEVLEHIATLATFLPGSQHPYGSHTSGAAGHSGGAAAAARGDKITEHLKKFFHEVGKDKALQKWLLQLTAPRNSCKKATEVLKDIVRRMVNPHAVSQQPSEQDPHAAAVTYANTVKALVERAAPVLLDAEAGQELITQLVFAREANAIASSAAEVNGKDKPISLERALKLIFAVAFYYKDVLSSTDTLEYTLAILEDILESPLPDVSGAADTVNLSDTLSHCVDRQQELELCLQTLNAILGDPRISASNTFLAGLTGLSTNNASQNGASGNCAGPSASLVKAVQKHLPSLLALLNKCCTRKSVAEEIVALLPPAVTEGLLSPAPATSDSSSPASPPSALKKATRGKGGKKKAAAVSEQAEDAAPPGAVVPEPVPHDEKVVELLSMLWQHQMRAAKLATRVYLNLYTIFGEPEETSVVSPKRSEEGQEGEEVPVPESIPKRSGTSALVHDGIMDLMKTCAESDASASNFVFCIAALGQVALMQPVRFRTQILQQAKMLLRTVIFEKSQQPSGSGGVQELTSPGGKSEEKVKESVLLSPGPGPSGSVEKVSTQPAAWTPDGLMSQRARVKVAAFKFISHWLYGTKAEEKERVKLVFNVCCKIILNEGDIRRSGTWGKELSRIRLAASLCWLKLAQRQDYVDFIEIRWFHAMAHTICDPCPEVRTHFLYKLHRGLFRFRLPLEYMAIFALVPCVAIPVAVAPFSSQSTETTTHSQSTGAATGEFLKRAKQRLQANVQRRREFLQRNPEFMQNPKRMFALLPENVLPYAIHLLAHDPRWTDAKDKEMLVKFKRCFSFLLEPLIVKGDNFSFLRKLIEKMKHSVDALLPEDATANLKLYILCDIALALLMTKTTNFVLSEYPVEIRLPRSLFAPAPDDFVNAEFAQLSEINSAAVPPSSKTTKMTPLLQFTPVKKSRAVSDGLLPANLLKVNTRDGSGGTDTPVEAMANGKKSLGKLGPSRGGAKGGKTPGLSSPKTPKTPTTSKRAVKVAAGKKRAAPPTAATKKTVKRGKSAARVESSSSSSEEEEQEEKAPESKEHSPAKAKEATGGKKAVKGRVSKKVVPVSDEKESSSSSSSVKEVEPSPVKAKKSTSGRTAVKRVSKKAVPVSDDKESSSSSSPEVEEEEEPSPVKVKKAAGGKRAVKEKVSKKAVPVVSAEEESSSSSEEMDVEPDPKEPSPVKEVAGKKRPMKGKTPVSKKKTSPKQATPTVSKGRKRPRVQETVEDGEEEEESEEEMKSTTKKKSRVEASTDETPQKTPAKAATKTSRKSTVTPSVSSGKDARPKKPPMTSDEESSMAKPPSSSKTSPPSLRSKRQASQLATRSLYESP